MDGDDGDGDGVGDGDDVGDAGGLVGLIPAKAKRNNKCGEETLR